MGQILGLRCCGERFDHLQAMLFCSTWESGRTSNAFKPLPRRSHCYGPISLAVASTCQCRHLGPGVRGEVGRCRCRLNAPGWSLIWRSSSPLWLLKQEKSRECSKFISEDSCCLALWFHRVGLANTLLVAVGVSSFPLCFHTL